MFVDPHLGQNFFLFRASSCFFSLIIDFSSSHFSFSIFPNSLKLNSWASVPHNGQCCPGSSRLSYAHSLFGQVHEVISKTQSEYAHHGSFFISVFKVGNRSCQACLFEFGDC